MAVENCLILICTKEKHFFVSQYVLTNIVCGSNVSGHWECSMYFVRKIECHSVNHHMICLFEYLYLNTTVLFI